MANRLSPETIWHDMHEAGHSREASDAATAVLSEIKTKNFTDKSQAKDHGEYARIAFVTALAAARRQRKWEEVQPLLSRLFAIATTNYPIAQTRSDAAKKGAYWEGVYGQESSALICLRDLLHFCNFLFKALPVVELESYIGGIELIIESLVQNSEERFALISVIESGPYENAMAAFEKYRQTNALATHPGFDPKEVITVTSRMIGRATDSGDVSTAVSITSFAIGFVFKNMDIRWYAIHELFGNASRSMKNALLGFNIRGWRNNVMRDSQTYNSLQNLLVHTEVGLGQKKTARISNAD